MHSISWLTTIYESAKKDSHTIAHWNTSLTFKGISPTSSPIYEVLVNSSELADFLWLLRSAAMQFENAPLNSHNLHPW